MAHFELGDKELAKTCYEKSETWLNEHDLEDEEIRRFREEAASVLGFTDSD